MTAPGWREGIRGIYIWFAQGRPPERRGKDPKGDPVTVKGLANHFCVATQTGHRSCDLITVNAESVQLRRAKRTGQTTSEGPWILVGNRPLPVHRVS